MAASSACLAYEVEFGFNRSHAQVIAQWKDHAASLFPQEACGVILCDGRFLPVPNSHPDPVGFFDVSEADHLAILAEGPILAFLHSHCDGPDIDSRTGRLREAEACPSASDMEHQQLSGFAWGISRVEPGGAHDPLWFGDELGRAPLRGRLFHHGQWDCMALIRDFHAELGITSVPNQPRDIGWWDAGQNLYLDNIERGGFERVQRVAPLPGDVFLCELYVSGRDRSLPTPLNHGGLYLGDNTILHHKPGRPSGEDYAHLWHSKLNYFVRHKDLPEDWRP